jgi:hypothetical protein
MPYAFRAFLPHMMLDFAGYDSISSLFSINGEENLREINA